MSKKMHIGFCYEHKVCPHCGKEFGFNGNDFDAALEAFEARKEHLRVCPVGYGWEKASKEWQDKLDRVRNAIEVHENNIAECREYLPVTIMPEILIGEFMDMVEKAINEEEAKISALKGSIGEDEEEFENLLEASLF